MKKQHLVFLLAPVVLVLSGCASFVAPPYASSPDIAISLRHLHQKYPNENFTVGTFSEPAEDAGMCRLAGPIVIPGHQSFTGYLRTSLMDELKLARMYSKSGGISITGNVQKITFSSNSGTWYINANIKIGNQPPLSIKESYDYDSSFGAMAACNATAQSYELAVQKFISQLISSSQFEAALKARQGK